MVFRLAAIFGGLMLSVVASLASAPVETVEMLVRHWTIRDGLPHNRVRSVIRTHDGFIWLATDGGAVRFDGANFKVFSLREGLLAPIVLAIRESPDDRLWIGTLGGGVSLLYKGGVERTYTTADGLPSNWVSGIETDADGAMVATTPNGAARFDGKRFQPVPVTGNPALPMRSLQRDGRGILWAIDRSKVPHIWGNGAWRPVPEGGPGSMQAIGVDPRGRLWAAGHQQLWCHDGNSWSSRLIPEEFTGLLDSLAITPDGTVWMAFHRLGLCGFRDGRFITPAASAGYSPDLVETVSVTSDGQLWVTSAIGFYRLETRRIHVSLIDDPKKPSAGNNLGGIIETQPGEFLVATQGSGFYRWKNGHASRLNDDPGLGAGVYGNVLLKTADGSIWLGANNGLYEMNPNGSITKRPLPERPDAPVWTLAEGPEGLWVGTSYGKLHLIRDGGIETIDYGGGKEPIKAIIQEPDGTVWVGSRGNGLFQRKSGTWQRMGRNSGLLSDIIRTLYRDPEGRLWVGSDGGGLALRRNGGFISVTSREGLPDDVVSQIMRDADGRLWIGTNRGLAVFDRKTLTDVVAGHASVLHPLLINEADGMSADELTIVPPVKTSDGSHAFATVSGFIRLRTEEFQPDLFRPEVFIEGISANGTRINFSPGTISLPAGTERLGFEFAGQCFHDPRRLKFRNRLTDIELEWVVIGDRRITEYRNLKPGAYQFQVQATTGNGMWSARPATVDIVIAPHFWQTWWFNAAAAAAGLGVVVLIVRRLERRRTRHKIEIMKRRQAVDAERARIARDLHDDVGASLTQMALQSQLVERNITRQPARAADYLQDIFKTASKMTRALDEIIWAVNPSHDTLENFILFLGSHVQEYAESSGLRSRFDVPDAIPQMMMPPTVRHHLYLAAKEVLHNAVKHADATEVTLQVKLGGGECVITISDNGRGFEEGGAAIGADGLINMRSRLDQIRGTCTRRSSLGHGTSVEMRVPMDWRDG